MNEAAIYAEPIAAAGVVLFYRMQAAHMIRIVLLIFFTEIEKNLQ